MEFLQLFGELGITSWLCLMDFVYILWEVGLPTMGLAAGESRRFTEGVMAISRSLTAWGAYWLRGEKRKISRGRKDGEGLTD